MASYVMEFSVRGPLAYLSHLELMKLFRQSFRRGALPISFSEGFNPHMKLSFAIAKGVGLESEGELLEIETDDDIEEENFLEKINKVIPEGLKVKTFKEKTISAKSLSSMLRKAKYLLAYAKEVDYENYEAIITEKLSKTEILMEVKTKKSFGVKDIKEYILDWNFSEDGVIIEVYAGSDKNLRIENLLKYLDLELKPVRLKLIGDNGPIIDKMSKEEKNEI
jgi:radical SAM-linked protein